MMNTQHAAGKRTCVRPAAVVVFLALGSFTGCCWFQKGQGAIVKAEELDGLRTSIASISWMDPSTASVSCKLEWVAPNKNWVLNPSEPFNILFWNAAGKLLTQVSVMTALDPSFISGTTKETTNTLRAKPPADAASVSVAFGSSGLETKITALPKRP